MRKLLSLVILFALAAGVWFVARWAVHRGEIRATIVLDNARDLRRGDPVLENGAIVGRITRVDPMDDRFAVTVRLTRDHRRAIVTDSMFAAESHALVVSNTFAVGTPVDDGAVLHPRQDRVTTWLAKHAGAVKPYIDQARARADRVIDEDFDRWTSSVPEWKREGQEALDRHLADVKERVTRAEADLRSANRLDEARKLKERFDRWLADVKR